MSVYTNHTKKLEFKSDYFAQIKCKCGSCRTNVQVAKDDSDEPTWLKVICKKCGNVLFYNGA